MDSQKQPGAYALVFTYKQRLLFEGGNTLKDNDGTRYELNKPAPIPLDPGSTPFTIPDDWPKFTIVMEKSVSKDIQPIWESSPEGPEIDVPKMVVATLRLSGPVADMSKTGLFWSDTVLLPTDEVVQVPLPKAPWFGKLTTSMQFAASGSGLVDKVEYNKTNGLADLFSSGAQVANQVYQPPAAAQTTTQKAADVQAQADLIYQQQRLIACQLSPTSCPSK